MLFLSTTDYEYDILTDEPAVTHCQRKVPGLDMKSFLFDCGQLTFKNTHKNTLIRKGLDWLGFTYGGKRESPLERKPWTKAQK